MFHCFQVLHMGLIITCDLTLSMDTLQLQHEVLGSLTRLCPLHCGGVANVDRDGKNALQFKAIGVVISTFDTLPTPDVTGMHFKELVASFQESRRGAPWPWWRVSAADEGGAVRKLRGTRWPRVRQNRHDPCTFYACTPEVCWLPMYAFPPHISIGWVGWQNLQPVKDKIRDWFASYYGCSMRIPLIC